MIIFHNVSKSYSGHKVLKQINLKIPDSGLIVIEGPSGCGKTTLLNLLSGLIDFEGDIQVDNRHIALMNKKEMDEFRLKKYGFVFQDFKLFENETVLNNILFPLDVISSSPKESKINKCQSLISMVGLKQSIKQKVMKLSGGEKQRVAIARALVNSPKIILADEPTGALDSKNAEEIMKILEKISSRSLVIVVSHDEELAKEYADQIIKMEDGRIKDIIIQEKTKKEKYIPISKMFFSNKKPSVPSSFLFNHMVSSIKQKKWRTMICNSVTSLGLIGVGLATSLSSSISANIKKSYSQIIDDNKITISQKRNEKSIYGQYAASYYEVMDIAENNKEDVIDVGITYNNDFENFFPHSNCIALADVSYFQPIEGITARQINDFKWLDVEGPDTIYPEVITELENDQVVLALTIDMIYDICFQLKIERTVTSLSRYLQTHQLKIYFDFRNDNWEYSDQQLLQVVGFSLEKNPGIYHTNHQWNEYMFEERMRFPTMDNISGQSDLPWYLKKIYYIQVKNDMNIFLTKLRNNHLYDPFIFEIANSMYYPKLYAENDTKNIQRLLVFANTLENMSVSDYYLFKDIEKDISTPIFGSISGYAIYPSSMLYGFSNMIYFSGNEDSLLETIDVATNMSPEANENMKLRPDVVSGHFSQSLLGGVNYSVVDESKIYEGRKALDLSEIVISSKLAKTVFDGGALNQNLYIGFLESQTKTATGDIIKKFRTLDLKVVGIIDSEKNVIYHDELWTINFFQIMLGVSAFNLGVNAIMVDVRSNTSNAVSKLKRAFPDYDIAEPMSDINKSVNQVCGYIEIALMCFSIIAVVISTLLLSICNYLYILENKKDIGLVRCIGVNKNEARKFVITHSVVMCFISFFLSSIELLLMSILISSEMAKQMGNTFTFSFNPLSLIYMFALAFSISIISSLFISQRLNKLDPISALKA